MATSFLDTNVLVYHLTQNHPVQSPLATAILKRIEDGELVVRTSDFVVFETVFTLQRVFKMSRQDIATHLLPILELPGIALPSLNRIRAVFDLFVESPAGFADCYHAVLMQRLGITEVFSFDRDFDKLPGIIRREA